MAALGTGSCWRCTSFSFHMAQLHSRHLWNAAILVASALLALVAERVAAAPARPRAGASDVGGLADVGRFVSRTVGDSLAPGFHASVSLDPFDTRLDTRAVPVEQVGVASAPAAPTVPSSARGGSGLTAILVADDRRVAVIDDAAVNVGDVLPDGARVSAIQPDRVWVVDKNGRWRMLTLTNRGTR
jgi:hypothetical protein